MLLGIGLRVCIEMLLGDRVVVRLVPDEPNPLAGVDECNGGGGVAHAPGVALVHGLGFRSGDPASLHLLEEPARTVSRVEAV